MSSDKFSDGLPRLIAASAALAGGCWLLSKLGEKAGGGGAASERVASEKADGEIRPKCGPATSNAAEEGSRSHARLLCRFGVITDVQYADIECAVGWDKYVRHFRGSLSQLSDAVAWWRKGPTPDFILQGGDLIDSRCNKCGIVDDCLHDTLRILKDVNVPMLHVVGNHELCCMCQSEWCQKVGTIGAPQKTLQQLKKNLGYSHWRKDGIRILILNSFQESVLAPTPTNDGAQAYLEECRVQQRFAEGQKTHLMHDCSGGLGRQQLQWLRQELTEAGKLSERVVICCHQPLHPKACEGISMPWDYEEALEAIGMKPGVVVAVLAGHYHFGGYHRDECGVHHLTLQAPLVRGATGFAYGTFEIFEDRLAIRGPRLVDLLHGDTFTGSEIAGWNDPPAARGWYDADADCEVWETLFTSSQL